MAIQIEIVLIAGVVAIGLIVLGRAVATGRAISRRSSHHLAQKNRRVAGAANGSNPALKSRLDTQYLEARVVTRVTLPLPRRRHPHDSDGVADHVGRSLLANSN